MLVVSKPDIILCHHPPSPWEGNRHFDFSSDNGWLCCAQREALVAQESCYFHGHGRRSRSYCHEHHRRRREAVMRAPTHLVYRT